MGDVKLSRRGFLVACGAVAACIGMPSLAMAKPKRSKQKPPGTCGGYVDKDGNGLCDHSEKTKKPCRAKGCPANKLNPAFSKLKEEGAPEGVCAQWSDPDEAGYCAVSAKKNGCLHKKCPQNKAHAE